MDDDPADVHAVYMITVASEIEPNWRRQVKRRYREFVRLQSNLCSAIKLPAKTMLHSNFSDAFLKSRCEALEDFLGECVKLYSVAANSPLCTFLTLSDSFSGASALALRSNLCPPPLPLSPSTSLFRHRPFSDGA